MADAILLRGIDEISKTNAAAVASGEVHQLADGRAAVYVGLNASAQGATSGWTTEGQFTVTKTASQVWTDGCPLWWDHSANAATMVPQVADRDFFIGTSVGDATSAATTGIVNLNVKPVYVIDLREGHWTAEATNGLGVTPLVGGGVQLAFDAVAEAAQAAIISERTVPLAANWILEARLAVFDGGNNAALDFDVGLAIGSHATDFEAITEFVSFHLDGNDASLLTQSDDGTTDVAPDDTDLTFSDDTFFHLVIDGRDPTDIQCYVNGVLVNAATVHTLTAATGPLKAIAHMEKTSNATPADVRLDFLRVRIAEQ